MGNLIRNLILIGMMLGAAGTLDEAVRQLSHASARQTAHGLLSLGRLNRALVGQTN